MSSTPYTASRNVLDSLYIRSAVSPACSPVQSARGCGGRRDLRARQGCCLEGRRALARGLLHLPRLDSALSYVASKTVFLTRSRCFSRWCTNHQEEKYIAYCEDIANAVRQEYGIAVRVNPGPQTLFPNAKILADERPGGACAGLCILDPVQRSQRRSADLLMMRKKDSPTECRRQIEENTI